VDAEEVEAVVEVDYRRGAGLPGRDAGLVLPPL
jgi:hypothetical protein